jgi:hypothetical protein
MALAAGIILVTGLTGSVLMTRSPERGTLAGDAVGDHRNCALKYRLIRTPVPLEEAARRFDRAYRVLRDTPPDDIATPDGTARVVDRHSCAYGTRRFGHIVLQYRGHVVSLLVTSIEGTSLAPPPADAAPHVLGPPIQHLSVVSVTALRHAVLLVGDLPERELTQLADVVSVPLSRELASARTEVAAGGITTVAPEILVRGIDDGWREHESSDSWIGSGCGFHIGDCRQANGSDVRTVAVRSTRANDVGSFQGGRIRLLRALRP